MTAKRLWRAVVARDTTADGLFVYAVRSTKIYCRPSCGSRKPRRDRVEFFPAPAMAEAGGYRACRRCRPHAARLPAGDVVGRVCREVARRPDARWTSAALARAGATSITALQRGFRRALDITPRDYVAACRRRRFFETLRHGRSVTDAIYEAGYGSPSRVYGRRVMLPGMTPASYGKGGAGVTIAWATTATPVGRVLVAATPKGLCFAAIGSDASKLRTTLGVEFPRATIAARPSRRLTTLVRVVRALASAQPIATGVPLDVLGTAFQWKVWQALTAIPAGETRSYGDVARIIGRPSASRAVARACATNPVPLVVPCHRVVTGTGATGGYRWGSAVKARLLSREAK